MAALPSVQPSVTSISTMEESQEYYYFAPDGTTDLIAEVECETDQTVTILTDFHMYWKKKLQDRLWDEQQAKWARMAHKKSPEQEEADRKAQLVLNQRREEAMKDTVKVRRTHVGTPADIRLRQDIRTRRDHNKTWIRFWQDKSCKYRVINFNNMMNVSKVDMERIKAEEMMADSLAMKNRFMVKLQERSDMIAAGTLDPNQINGSHGQEKAEKMVRWMAKVKEVTDLAENNDLDMDTKVERYNKIVARGFAIVNA